MPSKRKGAYGEEDVKDNRGVELNSKLLAQTP